MRVLGVSCDYHDAAAALVVDGEVVAAAEEERFSRTKHDARLPERAVASCLRIGGVDADAVDLVVFHEKPLAVIHRVVAARQRRGPRALGSFARDLPTLLQRNLVVGHRLEDLLTRLGAGRPVPVAYCDHHLSHAAAAFLPSPFRSAAIVTVDGIGEWATATIGRGAGDTIDLIQEQRYPHSLGLLYSLATVWCGFEANDGEYKLMGLAPFGSPRYREPLRSLVTLHDDGSVEVRGRAVRWWGGRPERMGRVADLLDGPPRRGDEPLDGRHADIARSVQDLIEEAMVRTARHAAALTGESALCLAGGVALNCVANARVLHDGAFDDVWVQPAAGDAGSAIGAALWGDRTAPPPPGGRARRPAGTDGMRAGELGPRFSPDEVAEWVAATGLTARRVPDPDERSDEVARALADGAVVGWFEGGMEFGPRALGHRSILADPRSPTVQRDINLRVKGRESFRPFAPAVLWEHATDWFDLDRPLPYMLVTVPVAAHRRVDVEEEPADLVARVQVPRSEVPACTHVDGSARVQTVHEDLHPAFHRLLRAFHARTGCPVLLNTSFNRAGEPIVCTPDDALSTARAAGLDLLVLEDHLIVPAEAGP